MSKTKDKLIPLLEKWSSFAISECAFYDGAFRLPVVGGDGGLQEIRRIGSMEIRRDVMYAVQVAIERRRLNWGINKWTDGRGVDHYNATIRDPDTNLILAAGTDTSAHRALLAAYLMWLKESAEVALPYPVDQGQTHYEGCWKDRGHHNCAVAKVREMMDRLERAN